MTSSYLRIPTEVAVVFATNGPAAFEPELKGFSPLDITLSPGI